jgi:hypothetical protein
MSGPLSFQQVQGYLGSAIDLFHCRLLCYYIGVLGHSRQWSRCLSVGLCSLFKEIPLSNTGAIVRLKIKMGSVGSHANKSATL